MNLYFHSTMFASALTALAMILTAEGGLGAITGMFGIYLALFTILTETIVLCAYAIKRICQARQSKRKTALV